MADEELAELIAEQMKAVDLRNIAMVPNAKSRPQLLRWEQDPAFQVVTACHEGEAVAIACGMAIAGKRAMVFMDTAGPYQAGEAVRAMAIDWQLPIVIAVSMSSTPTPDDRPPVGMMTMGRTMREKVEPWFRFWDVPYAIVQDAQSVERIAWAVRTAEETRSPVGLII